MSHQPTPAGKERTAAEQYPLCYVMVYFQLRSDNLILQAANEHLAALIARAEKAEARVKEMQAELAEQERAKLLLIQELLTAQRGSTTEMLTPALLALRYGLLAEERDGDVFLLPSLIQPADD